jgi:hypothetical protein
MRLPDQTQKPVFYFQADANALGGVLKTPEPKIIPPQASVSLPAVGGFATARSGEFNLEHIVSMKSAYTRVSGREAERDEEGSLASILVTSVIEGFNVLDVVTADRIVAQVAVECPVVGRRRISVAGSHFEGLRVAGVKAEPTLNSTLLQPRPGEDPSKSPNTWRKFQEVGREQAEKLLNESRTPGWIKDRYRWMTTDEQKRESPPALALCSLVDGLQGADPQVTSGHIVEIADFGRIFLAEVLLSPWTVRLAMIRVELGCNIHGSLGGAVANSNGTTVPPGEPD